MLTLDWAGHMYGDLVMELTLPPSPPPYVYILEQIEIFKLMTDVLIIIRHAV